jgi:hypothetical protein
MNKTCLECDKEIDGKVKIKFCGRSCSAKYNNKQRVSLKIEKYSSFIEESMKSGKTITFIVKHIGIHRPIFRQLYPDYCDSDRYSKPKQFEREADRIKKKKELFKRGKFESINRCGHPGDGIKWDRIKFWLKQFLIERDGAKCCKCGWGEPNERTGNIMVEIDHIDGDNKNNTIDNVRLLCPNCHSLTPTFRYSNRKK